MKTSIMLLVLTAFFSFGETSVFASSENPVAPQPLPAAERVPRPTAAASVRCCPHCANCRVVRECRERKKTVWVVESEVVCPVLPALPRLWPPVRCCEGACGANERCVCRTPAPVKCGKPRTVKRLVKKEVVYYEPRYRCVACGRARAVPETNSPLDASASEQDILSPLD